MKSTIIENFEDCFINEFNKDLFIDFSSAKKNYEKIQKTSKASKVCLALALTAFPASVLTIWNAKITACLGIAFFATLPAGLILNNIAKKQFQSLCETDAIFDYINYDIYNGNQYIKNRIAEKKHSQNVEKIAENLLNNNFKKLISIDETIKNDLITLDDNYDLLMNSGYDGNLNDLFKDRENKRILLENSSNNIKNHLKTNKNVYSEFVTDFDKTFSN